MGDLIRLAERREARRTRTLRGHGRTRVEFLFDLCCPFSYLAAERVERAFDDVIWTPAVRDLSALRLVGCARARGPARGRRAAGSGAAAAARLA
jgi:hypothetical protein